MVKKRDSSWNARKADSMAPSQGERLDQVARCMQGLCRRMIAAGRRGSPGASHLLVEL